MATLGRSLLKPAIKSSKWMGSRRCWHCGKQLQCKLGGGYHFAIIKDPIGTELRVHKDCVKRAIGDGYTEARPTATEQKESGKPLTHCAAGRDGECAHAQCPQHRDREPGKSGRHCPLDTQQDED